MAISVGNPKFVVSEQKNIYFLNLNDKNLFVQSDDKISKILEKKIKIRHNE